MLTALTKTALYTHATHTPHIHNTLNTHTYTHHYIHALWKLELVLGDTYPYGGFTDDAWFGEKQNFLVVLHNTA